MSANILIIHIISSAIIIRNRATELNGWINEELYLDYGLAEAENLPDLLNRYVYFFNNNRPAAVLGYKSPVQYKTELGFA